MTLTDWEEIAVAVRSRTHDRTWIGHMQGASFAETPAGPLRLVKDALVDMMPNEVATHRWRHEDDVTWRLEVRWTEPTPDPR